MPFSINEVPGKFNKSRSHKGGHKTFAGSRAVVQTTDCISACVVSLGPSFARLLLLAFFFNFGFWGFHWTSAYLSSLLAFNVPASPSSVFDFSLVTRDTNLVAIHLIVNLMVVLGEKGIEV